MRWVAVLAVVLGFGASVPAAGASPNGPTSPTDVADQYELAGGCYLVDVAGETTGPFRFQPTDLGRYLLIDVDGAYATPGGPVPTPAPEGDWQIDPVSGGFRMHVPSTGAAWPGGGPVGFIPAVGCPRPPEVAVNVTGPHLSGDTPYESVQGFFDAHLHVTAYEFLGGRAHCGRPWHRYGVTWALVDCADHEVADGAGAVLENFLSGGSPVATHDTVGWPTFVDWPAPSSLTHEQTYFRWIERAWRGGLRMFVNLFVENRVLCEIYPLKQNDCDEMASVRLQHQRIHELERYIDAQSGGPGEGWFRIVDDPFEAREVINDGKLAVVLGIEISEPFGCISTVGVPQCSEADIDAQLDELQALGVRQLVTIHKFDNALGGVAFDGGTKGNIINLGNFYGTGRFWDMETCDPDDTGVHDNDQSLPEGLDQHTALFGAILATFGPPGVLPVYPPPHHCNTLGLSALGAHAVQAMVDRQMIVDVDHMSVAARQEALALLEAQNEGRGYSGVISSHSWSTPDAYPRVLALGGVVAPYAGGSTGFVGAWRALRELAVDGYEFGIGFGADSNGLGAQGGPRADAATNPVRYPFRSLGGAVVDRQVSGQRTYDINVDGVAHYGLYPDWIEDLRVQAGDAIVDDLANGSEAYLQMWERATGIARPGCVGGTERASLRAGMTPEEVLRVAGQPHARVDDTFRYCVAAGDELLLRFDVAGRLVLPDAGVAAPGGRLPATGRTSPLPLWLAAVLLVVGSRFLPWSSWR